MNSIPPAVLTLPRRWHVSLAIVLFALAGCGGVAVDNRSEGEKRLLTVAMMYNRYAAAHQGAPPPDEKALKQFINSLPVAEGAGMKITKVDELFISQRDQKPFKVRYGLQTGGGVPEVPGGPGGPGAPSGVASTAAVIAYEETGLNGKHYAAFATGEVHEITDEEFQKLNLK